MSMLPAPVPVCFRRYSFSSHRSLLLLLISLLICAGTTSQTFAQNEGQESLSSKGFAANWKLLNSQEKQQFMAGYIQGWKDAAKIVDIAIEHVKENPDSAVEGLTSIKRLYDLRQVKPDTLAREIDVYFADPDNQNESLSMAVTAARNRLP